MTTIRTTLNFAFDKLRQLTTISIQNPRLEAEILLSQVLQQPRSYLMAWPAQVLTVEQIAIYATMLQQRLQGTPIAYIIGEWDFWNINLVITPDVLIPRPETELLVELALLAGDKHYQRTGRVPLVADLGTGSGAIAAAIAKNRPTWQVYATDLSMKALAVAETNFQRLGLTITTFNGNWYEAVPPSLRFDVIVSNPPYIAAHDPHLEQGDVQQEPTLALVSGIDGNDALRTLCNGALDWLQCNGVIFLEHGYQQGEVVRTFLHKIGMQQVQTWRDLAGHERVTGGCLIRVVPHETLV